MAAWGKLSRTPEELEAWYSDVYPRTYKPDPRTESLLARMESAGMPWGVVTNGPAEYHRVKVQVLGLEARAGAIAISGELGIRKPEPEIFRCGPAPAGRDR